MLPKLSIHNFLIYLVVQDSDNDGYPDGVDCNPNDPSIYPGAVEQCNYIDDNCDGIIDDGNPGGGVLCGTDSAFCQTGITVCIHDNQTFTVEVICQGAILFEPEKCDGFDNNCDGSIDEGCQ